MKKVLYILIPLLIISLGLNGYLIYKNINKEEKEDQKYILKYNNKVVTEEQYINDSFEYMPENYYIQLWYDIMYDNLSKDEIEAVQDEVDTYIDSLKKQYGDDLEESIYSQNYISLNRYKKLYTVPLAYQNRVDKECNGKKNCTYTLKDEYLKVLNESNIKIDNKKAKKTWEEWLEKNINTNSNKESSSNKTNDNTKEDKDQKTDNQSNEFKILKEINDIQLNSYLKSEKNLVVVFTITSCSHCLTFKPRIDNVAYNNNLKVYYIELDTLDTNVWDELREKYSISGTPTTVYFKNGTKIDSIVGDQSEENIKQFFKKNNLIK